MSTVVNAREALAKELAPHVLQALVDTTYVDGASRAESIAESIADLLHPVYDHFHAGVDGQLWRWRP